MGLRVSQCQMWEVWSKSHFTAATQTQQRLFQDSLYLCCGSYIHLGSREKAIFKPEVYFTRKYLYILVFVRE